MLCVTDANTWIDLHAGRLLRHAFALGDDFRTTDIVFREVQSFDRAVLTGLGLTVVTLPPEQLTRIPPLSSLYPRASRRDLSALVVARDLHAAGGATLVTGDGALRKAAETEGVPVHGTLWLLDRMVDGGLVTAPHAALSLRLMVQAGSWLPKGEVGDRLGRWEGGR